MRLTREEGFGFWDSEVRVGRCPSGVSHVGCHDEGEREHKDHEAGAGLRRAVADERLESAELGAQALVLALQCLHSLH